MSNPDVIVIGAGAGGPVIAKELAERGAKVTMLEAGPWLDPDRDFSLLEDDMFSIVEGRFRWGPDDRSKGAWMRRRDGVGLILQTAGVGGTTLHYNGISVRAFPGATESWPISYDELIPYYEQVEAFLPVRQVEEHELATKDAIFAMGCEKVGLVHSESKDITDAVWRRSPNAILPVAKITPGQSLTWPDVEGCTQCGFCIMGCPHPAGAPIERKAKRATNVTYVPVAVATGNCEVVPNAFATAILFDEAGKDGRAKVRGVRWRDTATGETQEAEAPIVVLAGGSIESPRLWLNSGLPNSGDAVGRYLTTHLQDVVTGFFDRDVNPDVGQVTMARADFPGYGVLFSQGNGPQNVSIVTAGGGKGFWDEAVDAPWDFQGRFWGEAAVRRMREYSKTLSVLVCTDDEDHGDNRVTLADDWGPDEHGAVPKVSYHATPASLERQDWLARKAVEILRAAGAREVHRANFGRALLTHIMGTMRMGRDPSTSVVNTDGEAHEVEGLFVGDSSILPNGLGGPNPTLTAQAFAARTADRIAARLGGRGGGGTG